MNDWTSIRKQFPLLDKVTYLNTASSGPIAVQTAKALKDYAEDLAHYGSLHRSSWIEKIDLARKLSAELLAVQTHEIGFVGDVSTGMNQLAAGINSRRKVLLIEDDFPSTALPWAAYGFEIEWVKRKSDLSIDYTAIERALANGCQILAISWIHYNSGVESNLELLGDLCSTYGALFIVDGTQGLSTRVLDVKKYNISVFMSSTFKWLTAGYGSCILYINAEAGALIENGPLGWNSLNSFDSPLLEPYSWKKGAQRWETGHWNYMNLIGLATALEKLSSISIGSVEKRIRHLKVELIAKLEAGGIEIKTPNPLSHGGGIITIKGTEALFQKLQQQQVITTFRKDYLRISFHYYNTEEDFDNLLNILLQ